ncbi:autotransporter assembly complex protein TamA [Methylomonas sp. SURF-2]|uniref:Translocation and assembly module subunit TamA n=1 Tax=Methylomonas subterranea TaxID=2952225 RepID=A0ABT1TCI7_9GAMM|nr:autotransporter assembly complex family protein [Methylomonas sp. SURF-2]MCQ8102812.1 autotransporter assembly complex protein TamA [Methylomonas sp. SURF-2]
MHIHFPRLRRTALLSLLGLSAPAAGDVAIQGLASEAESNVKQTLSLAKEHCDSPEWKIRQLYDKAGREIDEALRALGYYHAVSGGRLEFDAACWHAQFDIHSGPRVMLENIEIAWRGEAGQDEEFTKLADKLRADIGTGLHHGRYESMKSRMETLALERGYFKGRFLEKTLLVDRAGNTAQIRLVYDSGPRLFFGEIQLDQDILEPDFVHKLIGIETNTPYHSAQLAKTHNDLSNSGYFEMVDIHPQLEQQEQLAQNRVPINVKLYPKKAHHYSLGLGYDTDKGPLLAAAYMNRRLNRQGHFFNADIDLSPVLSTATAEYGVPLANPVSDSFGFGGGLKREETDSYRSLSGKLSARLKHAFDNGWKQTLYVDSVYESFTADAQQNNTQLLLPGGSWLRSVADDTLRPTRGYRLELNLSGSYKNPVSDISMAQASIAAVWMQPLPWRGRLIARAEQAATLVDNFAKLPASYRYYAGGMNSIRGYAYKELGPRDAQGRLLGGRFLSVASLEYEQAVLDDWGVAAFIDAGNAYNPDDIRIKAGAGLGLRWHSPIGPIRIDLAVPLGEADSSFQFHFAAGTRL